MNRPSPARAFAGPAADPPFDGSTPSDLPGLLTRFDAILVWAREHRSRLGYFAALYRGVTIGAATALAAGAFERPDAAQRLIILFAGRYFDAFDHRLHGKPTTRSWQAAFDAADRWAPTVLQHLLLGINAHINLDLGIAAARTRGELDLPRSDFDRVNDMLVEMMDDVQAKLAVVWPLLRLLDWMAGRLDENLVGFALRQARADAWVFGESLLVKGADTRTLIDQRDQHVAGIARHIVRPGPLLRAGLATVRLGEMRSVVGIIDLLAAETLEAGATAGLAVSHGTPSR
jgi:hypothetical protein